MYVLLGGELYHKLFIPEIRKGSPGVLVAQNTSLGWLLDNHRKVRQVEQFNTSKQTMPNVRQLGNRDWYRQSAKEILGNWGNIKCKCPVKGWFILRKSLSSYACEIAGRTLQCGFTIKYQNQYDSWIWKFSKSGVYATLYVRATSQFQPTSQIAVSSIHRRILASRSHASHTKLRWKFSVLPPTSRNRKIVKLIY